MTIEPLISYFVGAANGFALALGAPFVYRAIRDELRAAMARHHERALARDRKDPSKCPACFAPKDVGAGACKACLESWGLA